MHVCILTDFSLPSFVRIGILYARTFEELGWKVDHLPMGSETTKFTDRYDCVFQNVSGRNFKAIKNCKNIGLFVHEWSHYPTAWRSYLDDFDALWTTTQHCKTIAERSELKPSALWIPPVFDLEAHPQKNSYHTSTPFRFLYIGEWHFRKGLHLLLESWQHAFPEIGEAQLTIKTSADCNFKSPREDIQIVVERWPVEMLNQAYIESDCYVSASLGEGWGLPIMEAIRSGLPVCANLWGGHSSMLTSESCFEIEHQEIPQVFAPRPEVYAPGQTCGFSSETRISKALRRAVNSSENERKNISAKALNRLNQDFSIDAFKERISAAFI
ncbi:MAG: glycosyltransferase [Verrucomicrobiota bacterium]